MLESDDSDEGKSELGVMAMTMDKEAVRESPLWHFCLAHLRVDAVRKSSKGENGIPTLPEVPRCVCTGCVYGKITRKPFPSLPESSRATRVLKVIHNNIAGLIHPVSSGGSCYLLLFTDDFTRYKVGYMLKKKSDALKFFKE